MIELGNWYFLYVSIQKENSAHPAHDRGTVVVGPPLIQRPEFHPALSLPPQKKIRVLEKNISV